MNDTVIVLLVIVALTLAAIAPSVTRDIRDARAARREEQPDPTPPIYRDEQPDPDLPIFYTCGTRGCSKTQDPKTGEYRCGTCGRPLAITKETAS